MATKKPGPSKVVKKEIAVVKPAPVGLLASMDLNKAEFDPICKSVGYNCMQHESFSKFGMYDDNYKVVKSSNEIIGFWYITLKKVLPKNILQWNVDCATTCNEILTTDFFNNIRPWVLGDEGGGTFPPEKDCFYLVVNASAKHHGHILDNLNHQFKTILGDKFKPVEKIPVSWDAATIDKCLKTIQKPYLDTRVLSEDDPVFKKMKKLKDDWVYPLQVVKNERNTYGSPKQDFSQKNYIEIYLTNMLVLKIPIEYGYSSLTTFAMGIAIKVGAHLDHEKDFDTAYAEFLKTTNKQIKRSEPIGRWRHYEAIMKKLRNSKFLEVFKPYDQKSEYRYSGYDTLTNNVSRLRRELDRVANINDFRYVTDAMRQLDHVTNTIDPKFIKRFVNNGNLEALIIAFDKMIAVINKSKVNIAEMMLPTAKEA